MAISTKGKRKVHVKGRQYLWTVEDSAAPDVPEEGFVQHPPARRSVHIISSNKRFIVRYYLPQPGEPHARMDVEGPEFPREPGARRVLVPRWRHDAKPYPTADFVRRLICWSLGLAEQADDDH